MSHSVNHAMWRHWVAGLALVALHAVAPPSVGIPMSASSPMAQAVDTADFKPSAQRIGGGTSLEKPTGLDDAEWAALQSAIRKSAVQQARLSAGSLGGADGMPNDFFGESVALDGDTVLIGAYGDDVGQNYTQGSAFIFTRSGTSWTLQAQLTVDDGADDGEFGYSVALDGDTALVGAWRKDIGGNDDQGSAYIFTRSGETWTQQAKLTASDGSANDQFGVVVALDGDTAIIGASADGVGANSRQGSAYVFARNGTEWIQQAQLVADDGAANDEFGFAVALEGDTAVVGAWGDDVGGITNQGSAYVFVRSGIAWMQQAHLTANDGAESDYFGVSVALSDDTALVGMFGDDIGGSSTHGSAYVFTRSGSLWTLQSKLTDADGLGDDYFGWAVALSHDVALVGALRDDAPNALQGSAYVFTRSGTTWTQQAQLTADEGEGYEEFGISVALDGDTALVGAWLDDIGANRNQGSANVFARSGSVWTQQATLTPGDAEEYDNFGWSVAIAGDTALVGAMGDDVGVNSNQGSAYVFTRSGTNWTQQAKLTADDGVASDFFGVAVALSNNTALVGMWEGGSRVTSSPGAVYVFTRSGVTWSQQAKLTAADGAAGDEFGTSVALDGDVALVGAYSDDIAANSDQGSTYVFIRNGTTWTQQAKLTSDDGASGDRFGASIALDGDAVLVGAHRDDIGTNSDQGSAYFITRNGTTWTQQAKLTVNDGASGDNFGVSVALSGDEAVVGAYGADIGANSNQGAAYVFRYVDATWTQLARLTADDGATDDYFGGAVALSGDAALLGAYGDDVGSNADQGSAYVFTRVGTTWAQQTKLTAGDGASFDEFGGAIALDQGIALAGAYRANDWVPDATSHDNGAAYVFVGASLQPQSISFANPGPQAFGTMPTLSAIASSGLTVSFSSVTTSVCTVTSAGLLTFVSAGICTINADQIGNTSFSAAPQVQHSFAVNAVLPGAPTVAIATAGNMRATVSFSPPAFDGGSAITEYAVTSSPGGISSVGSHSPITVAGLTNQTTYTFTITATNTVGEGAASAPSNAVTPREDQAALTVLANPSTLVFDATSALSVNGGSGTGSVSFAVTSGADVCEVNATTLTAIGVGTCTVAATKAADENFNAATAMVDVTVTRANQALLTVVATPSSIPLTRTAALSTNGGSGSGAVSFDVTEGAANCSIDDSMLTGSAVGTCTVTATKAADLHYHQTTAQSEIEVLAATDLEISKDDGAYYALPGGVAVYEILVANAGPLPVEGVQLLDELPGGLADALWTCASVQLASCPQAAGEGGIDQTLNLPVDGVLRYLLSARVDAALGSKVTNTATIATPADVIELQPADNSATDSDHVGPEGVFGNGFEAPPNLISVPLRSL